MSITSLKMKRAKDREIAAGKVPLDALETVMDVVRRGGFVPDDYVPLKGDTVIYSDPDLNGNLKELKLHLPKEEEVSSKRYIIENLDYFVIGNTDTNEAIVTCNPELKQEFEGEGYQYEYNHSLRGGKTGDDKVILRGFMGPDFNVQGITFKDKKLQNRWEKHQHRQNKQFALIRAQTYQYHRKHSDELIKEAKMERSIYPEGTSLYVIMINLAEKHVLKERKIARRKTRNMTTTRDYLRDQIVTEQVMKRLSDKGIAYKKTKEAPKEQPVEPAPQEKPVSAPLWKRIFNRNSR